MRTAIAFDTETALFKPGHMSPQLACITYDLGEGPEIVDCFNSEDLAAELLDSGAILYGHNVAFDTCVLAANFPRLVPKIFQAYDEDRITCTKLRMQLLDIAAGTYRGKMGDAQKWIKYGYSLDDLTSRLFGIRLQKDVWRLRYSEFIGVPMDQWTAKAQEIIDADPLLLGQDPQGCITYPLEDAKWTRAVYEIQAAHEEWLKDQFRQARWQFTAQLMSNWGIRTNAQGVSAFRHQTEQHYTALRDRLITRGLVKKKTTKKRNGTLEITFTRDTKAAADLMTQVCEAEDLPLRKTDTGGVCLDEDACTVTGDPDLADYAAYSTASKVLKNDCEMLEKGVVFPVHASFGLAETGRTTCSKPNLQNVRTLPGIRECFEPRPGKVFFDADYPGLELFTFAQAAIHVVGFSEMSKVLLDGEDPHLQLAATIMGISYKEAKARKADKDVQANRQTAKVANFGFPGGLGAPTFTIFAWKQYGVKLTEQEARTLRANWMQTWKEAPTYFDKIGKMQDPKTKLVTLEQYKSQRTRGGARFTSACNTWFQGLGADATKAAGYVLAKSCYLDRTSPLYGSRLVNYVHDQFIGETDDNPYAHEVAVACADIMVSEANKWLPDVPIPRHRMEPLLMRYWSKDAKPVFDSAKRLVPWSGVSA